MSQQISAVVYYSKKISFPTSFSNNDEWKARNKLYKLPLRLELITSGLTIICEYINCICLRKTNSLA